MLGGRLVKVESLGSACNIVISEGGVVVQPAQHASLLESSPASDGPAASLANDEGYPNL